MFLVRVLAIYALCHFFVWHSLMAQISYTDDAHDYQTQISEKLSKFEKHFVKQSLVWAPVSVPTCKIYFNDPKSPGFMGFLIEKVYPEYPSSRGYPFNFSYIVTRDYSTVLNLDYFTSEDGVIDRDYSKKGTIIFKQSFQTLYRNGLYGFDRRNYHAKRVELDYSKSDFHPLRLKTSDDIDGDVRTLECDKSKNEDIQFIIKKE